MAGPRERMERRQSYAAHAQEHLKGDRGRRRAVPMPKNLDELKSRAASHYGYDHGKIRLHHRGADELHQHHHVEKLEHGDVVVVRGQHHRRDPGDLMTTHQSVYRPHKIEPKQQPSRPPPSQPVPFEGASTYKTSYNEHPVAARPSPKKAPLARTVPFEGSSTYANDFFGHSIGPRPAFKPPPRAASVPFEGMTTYVSDYPGHAPAKPAQVRAPKRNTSVPFEGSSTYRDTYIGHEVTPRHKPKAPPPLERKPFEGTTEYATRYLENEIPRTKFIYIEPAASVSSSPSSVSNL